MSSQEGTGGGDGGGGGEGERGGGAGVPPIKAAITPPNCLLAITGANKFARRLRRKSAESKQKAVKAKAEKAEALQKKRDEAERKARRGEIDPTHEFTFLLVGQVGLDILRPEDSLNAHVRFLRYLVLVAMRSSRECSTIPPCWTIWTSSTKPTTAGR